MITILCTFGGFTYRLCRFIKWVKTLPDRNAIAFDDKYLERKTQNVISK